MVRMGIRRILNSADTQRPPPTARPRGLASRSQGEAKSRLSAICITREPHRWPAAMAAARGRPYQASECRVRARSVREQSTPTFCNA
eukprot:8556648-Lingulodinium_polyedra.AAC.1